MKVGYLIDMDGVIYRENHLIAGAEEFVQALTETGTPFLFLTNNSAPTPEDLAVRLKHLGGIPHTTRTVAQVAFEPHQASTEGTTR